ncbi:MULTISPECIES: AAA family ATPase [Nocardia]|uniref:AAA family ATPase n=1 Tax=Nocardia TaxID=1817 RepID=UPI0007E9D3F0|nr:MULTISPECIES: SMC family ATPase [Nocardia]MBF6277146.1 SMC family ATPase [Nocardia nova]OBA54781.1 double-stranded DNA exonuclease [Nocardia sp. 852002-51101_SCH5132738]OBB51992.1 double-stranded DNA exonuclease [Nocardia sp. 852002-51244_SCH5132740]OBF72482.1 double-stranded DNA exonuclease [Mycobacterium sp. 852002-51759_SCH5129042]
MRLHRLELTAFGPFAETARVDFDELGADGLFLLHGHTGAGKTTVLDAIAFALYGRVPGARGESKRLHSDHADPQTAPRVVLEATLGGRRLRLTRSPEFERPKKRGTGMRTEQAAATLEWLDGRGQHLSRIPDIGDEVSRLLGMSADQFFQVVLLPQGDFARFLRSDNEDREKLLERLFDTERFGTVEQWLAQRRRESAAQLDNHRQSVDRLIAQVAITAGLGATEAVGPLEAVEWSQQLLAQARAEAERSATDLARCQEDSAQRHTAAEEHRRVQERRERAAIARRQLDDYAAGAPDRDRVQADLDRARRVEPVAAALADARTAAVILRRRTDEARDLAERLAVRLLEPESAELPGTTWAATELAAAELADTDMAEELSAIPAIPDISRAAADDGVVATAPPPEEPGAVDEPIEWELFSIDLARPAAAPESRGNRTRSDAGAQNQPGRSGGQKVAGALDDSGTDAAGADRGLDAAVQRWSAHIGSLEEVRADAESAVRVTAELAGLRTEYATVSRELEQLSQRREQLPQAIRSAEVALREAADAKAALPGLERECERTRAAAQAAVELVGTRKELATATEEFERARADHTDARERTLDLRERRLAGMAAELAGALVEGQPCTVCGSADHPAPARPTAVTVAKSDEDAAVQAERAAEQRRDRALTRRTELERRIELLGERGGNGDPAELAAAVNAATEQFRSAQQKTSAAADRGAEVERLRTAETELHSRLRELESRSSAVQERILAADRRLAELTDRVRVAAGADGTVERRRARLDALIADATDLLTARTDAAVADDQFADLARRVEQTARAADLPAAPEPEHPASGAPDRAVLAAYAKVVAAATRTPQQQKEMEAELVAADRRRAHAEAVLAEPEVRAAADADAVDLTEVETAVAEARRALDAAVAAHAESTRRVAQLEELGSQLWAAADRIAPLQQAHTELEGLADVVAGRGANNRRMSLRSYVLAARLEEVAIAGSARLRRMSGGRYEFVHSDAAGPRGRRGGLGLDIRDDYTGAVRPAKTLSGGETFMASLSLALGLADVVAAESGGLVLDTLFIDEGFGSLDADTLDAVMGVLDELRSGGRVVGVVSHVDEMRQRIPSRLHVIREPTGSRLRTIVA